VNFFKFINCLQNVIIWFIFNKFTNSYILGDIIRYTMHGNMIRQFVSELDGIFSDGAADIQIPAACLFVPVPGGQASVFF
jgi:hypothetical protein